MTKKIIAVALGLVLTFAFFANVNGSQPSNVRTVTESIDTVYAESVEPELLSKQREYYTMTGRFFQGLDSHFSTPDGEAAGEYPDGWYTHPTDQQYRWKDFEEHY